MKMLPYFISSKIHLFFYLVASLNFLMHVKIHDACHSIMVDFEQVLSFSHSSWGQWHLAFDEIQYVFLLCCVMRWGKEDSPSRSFMCAVYSATHAHLITPGQIPFVHVHVHISQVFPAEHFPVWGSVLTSIPQTALPLCFLPLWVANLIVRSR